MRMTVTQWDSAHNPDDLLRYLQRKKRCLPSARKLRLFGCACVNRIHGFLADERLAKAIEVSERYSDGLTDERTFRAARRNALQAARAVADRLIGCPRDEAWLGTCAGNAASALVYLPRQLPPGAQPSAERLQRAAMHVALTSSRNVLHVVRYGKRPAKDSVGVVKRDRKFQAILATVKAVLLRDLFDVDSASPTAGEIAQEIALAEEYVFQSDLLRDIFGNPFRKITFDPACVTTTVIGVAEAIYNARAFDRMPILADALEEAGCTNADILTHCRGPGSHVRGCWVIDLLMGKE